MRDTHNLKLKRQAFNLPEIQIQGLKELALKEGVNLSEFVRRVLSDFLRKNK